MKTDLDHLLKTKQFYAASWRAIDSGRHASAEDVVSKVSAIVREAIVASCYLEVAKIMRTFDKYVDHATSVDAHTLLNETTAIDLQPDDLELPSNPRSF